LRTPFLLNKRPNFAIFQAMSDISKIKKYKSPTRLLPESSSYDYAGVLSRLETMIGILKNKEQGKDNFIDFLRNYVYFNHSPIDDRLIFNYSTFFEAKMLIVFFESMPKEDQQMEIEYNRVLKLGFSVDKSPDVFEELIADFENIEENFIKLESENKEKLEKVLNSELKYKIAYWQGYLSLAMLRDDLPESDPSGYMDSREDFCHMRTKIEYFRLAVYWIGRLDPKRLEKLPFFGEFEERLKKLDIFLKWKLKKPTRLGFYNDPSFWWSDKTYTYPENTVAEDFLPGEVSEEPVIDEKDFRTSFPVGTLSIDFRYYEKRTRNKLSEEVKNLFPVPGYLPGNFFEDFNNWAYLFEKKHTG